MDRVQQMVVARVIAKQPLKYVTFSEDTLPHKTHRERERERERERRKKKRKRASEFDANYQMT